MRSRSGGVVVAGPVGNNNSSSTIFQAFKLEEMFQLLIVRI